MKIKARKRKEKKSDFPQGFFFFRRTIDGRETKKTEKQWVNNRKCQRKNF